MTAELPPAEAQCPRCGYMTLRLVAGTLSCDRPRAECGYEHLVTVAMPIIRQDPSQGT